MPKHGIIKFYIVVSSLSPNLIFWIVLTIKTLGKFENIEATHKHLWGKLTIDILMHSQEYVQHSRPCLIIIFKNNFEK